MNIRHRTTAAVDQPRGALLDEIAPSPRVDWRFLLPRGELGRVGVHGTVPAGLLAAIATCAAEVHELPGATGPFDTVVTVAPRAGSLRTAMAAVAPGGTLRIEDLAIRARRSARRELGRAGFTTTTWWARPSTGDPRCLVCLDRPRAASTVLRTVAGRGRRAGPESRFAASGLARLVGRRVSLIAIAPGPDGHPDERPAVAAPRAGTTVSGLITPGFAASRAVIGVTTDASEQALSEITKIARARADQHLIAAEADALDQFLARSVDARMAPANHHLGTHAGHLALVEDAAQGRPLDRRVVRRDPAAALRAGMGWLDRVPVSAPSDLTADGRYEELLMAPLDAIANLESRDPDRRHDRVERARRLLDRLQGVGLPVVFEHGDFSHPNLFLRHDGELVVIDWELARPRGLPLHDVTFFVAYLAESVDRPRDDGALVAANRRAWDPHGWARAEIDRHAERLDLAPHLLPLLQLACWTRAVAGLAPTAAPRPTPHRCELLWAAAIEDAEETRP